MPDSRLIGGIDHGYPYPQVESWEFRCDDCDDPCGELKEVKLHGDTREVCPRCAKKYEEE